MTTPECTSNCFLFLFFSEAVRYVTCTFLTEHRTLLIYFFFFYLTKHFSLKDKFIAVYLAKSSCCDAAGPSAEDIAEVRREVQCFTLASHLFWSFWAIVNMYQEIEFGYLEYAVCRLNEYIKCKKQYTELINNSGNSPTKDGEK